MGTPLKSCLISPKTLPPQVTAIHPAADMNHLVSTSFLFHSESAFFGGTSKILWVILRKSGSNQTPSASGQFLLMSLFLFTSECFSPSATPDPGCTSCICHCGPSFWIFLIYLGPQKKCWCKIPLPPLPINHSRSDFATTLLFTEFFRIKLSCELSLETISRFFSFFKVSNTCIQAFTGEEHRRVTYFDEMYV